jgi:glycosyltransferase involved in cell wall biosynthesis
MKILHLIWSLVTGGAENMLVDIVNQQSASADIVVLIGNTEVDKAVLNQFRPEVDVRFLNRPPGSRNLWYLLKLYRILGVINPDVIHSHHQSFIKFLSYIKIPKVLTVHDTGIKLIDGGKNYDKIFSISGAVDADLKKRYPNINSTIVLNGIVFSEFDQKSSFNHEYFNIVQISRLDHSKKGQDILIKALKYVNNEIGEGKVKLSFIGAGLSLDYLTELAKNLGVERWCSFLGKCPRKYIYDNLKNYDLLVQPSRYEGFGLTVVEAMAARVPVLASNIEGPLEIIDNGKMGYGFQAEDDADCAKKILQIKRRSEDASFLDNIKRIAICAKDKYDIQVTTNRYIEEYQKVIVSKRGLPNG